MEAYERNKVFHDWILCCLAATQAIVDVTKLKIYTFTTML